MKLIIFITLVSILGCNSENTTAPISNADRESVKKLHENYRDFWLENDSTKVVNLFCDDGAIIPPNNKNDFVVGKIAIGAWWFTAKGDTTYPITLFKYRNDTLTASGNLAFLEGLSEVGWDTKVKDSVLSSHTSVSNFITICKKENSEWKIYRQIWNLRPKK